MVTLQYSCLEKPMDRGPWWATGHGVAENQTLHTATTGLWYNYMTAQQAERAGEEVGRGESRESSRGQILKGPPESLRRLGSSRGQQDAIVWFFTGREYRMTRFAYQKDHLGHSEEDGNYDLLLV